ncbi:MAG: hypothetical protein ACTJG4_14000 [Vreelandella alkaliphila]|uniref:hypothetical protein n=1 Tax=Halomonadaceae TaxID=28256 RepID=UPI000E835460|nr:MULTISPECIES: hypothetical protein [unclassified Halomonas]HBP40286.1 hypothetical protein [Halomonas sp.]HBS84607.1 hypothetical protein [Halomonas campaniensis]
MKMLKLGLIVSALGFLGGCAAAGVTGLPSDTAEKNFVFDKEFDNVWEATVEWFASNNTPIDNVDKNSGLISSNYGLNPGSGIINCGQPTGNVGLLQANFEDVNANINVIVRDQGEQQTRATVNIFGKALVVVRNGYGQVMSSASVDCVSTGSYEKSYQDYVDNY